MTAAPGNAPRIGAEFILVALLFLTAGWMRLNDLFYYTPDSARYLIWGNSIARGEGWLDDTQPEPNRWVVHAPLYPLLISPVERIFPLGTVEVKAYTLLWGAAGLLFLYLWLLRLLGRIPALAGGLMLALNPGFLVYSTEVLTEAPFIALLLLVLWLMTVYDREGELTGGAWWALIAAGSLIGLLREAGVAVTACVALRLWSVDRKKSLTLVACAGAALGLWYLRNSVLVGVPPGAPGGNVSMLFRHVATAPDDPILSELGARVASNAASYLAQIGGMGFYPLYGPQHIPLLETPATVPDAFRLLVFAVLGTLMLFGLARSVLRGEWFPAAVAAGIFLAASVYPVRDARFMAPLLPLMIVYLLSGVQPGGRRRWIGSVTAIAAAAVVIVPNREAVEGLLALNRRYLDSPPGLHAGTPERTAYPYYYMQPWGLLGDSLTGLPPGAVLAAPAKELALVSGGRKVLELDPGVSQSLFDRLLRTNDVSYLLAPVRWGEMKVYEPLMSGSPRCVFTEVLAAGNLHLFRVEYRPFEPAADPIALPPPGSSASAYLRAARSLIRAGRYAAARALLDSAMASEPARPEIWGDAVEAASLAGDSSDAAAAFLGLTQLPQAGSYIARAEQHLRLLGVMREVSALPTGAERSMRTLDASRFYWEMGLYARAMSLLAPEMETDTAFFVGHLWDFHYHFQTGDTAAARRSLRRLDRIDSANSLVRNFHSLMDLRKAVRKTADPRGRSALRLQMAQIYRSIELFDEALDEAHAAAADDPGSGDAAIALADLYSSLGYTRRALSLYRAYLTEAPADNAVRARADSLAGLAGR